MPQRHAKAHVRLHRNSKCHVGEQLSFKSPRKKKSKWGFKIWQVVETDHRGSHPLTNAIIPRGAWPASVCSSGCWVESAMAIELALARRIIKMSKTSQLQSLKRVLIDQELWKCWERNRSIIRQQTVIGKNSQKRSNNISKDWQTLRVSRGNHPSPAPHGGF